MRAPMSMYTGPVFPRLCGALLGCAVSLHGVVRADEERVAIPVQKQVDTALHSVLLVAGVLVVLILVAVAIIVYRKALSPAQPGAADFPGEASPDGAAEERRGNFGAAAARYEAGGEPLRAAECWEKSRDLQRAAACWEAAGELDRAAQLHVRSGNALLAAEIYLKQKNYIEAAKIFRNKGDHLRAAEALEQFGNKLAAAREYSAAGRHAHAARLFEQEKMYAEAALAYQPLVSGAETTAGNADQHCTHADLLALAGEVDQAAGIYQRILAAVPGQQRAVAGLKRLQPPAPEPAAAPIPTPVRTPVPAAVPTPVQPPRPATEPPAAAAAPAPSPEELARLEQSAAALAGGDPLHRVFTLRSMMHAGRMEPRYGMRLWVQVMRALAERHGADGALGCLSPEAIVIDMENNVRLEAAACAAPYLSPEVRAGHPPGPESDIYSMGVILFELVGGSLDQFGASRAGQIHADVPAWLDELIERCTEPDPARRYRTTEEVSAALLKLKSEAPG